MHSYIRLILSLRRDIERLSLRACRSGCAVAKETDMFGLLPQCCDSEGGDDVYKVSVRINT